MANDDEVSVNTQGMSNAIPGFEALVGRVGSASSTFASRLAEAGAAWGGDATGKAFANSYLSANENLKDALPGVANVLRSGDERMTTSVKGYVGTNDQNNAAIDLGSGDG
jgi:uncharacterized protein YukE